MVDRLEVALRRYERIRPTPDQPLAGLKAEELSDWLDRDVCPVIQELLRRPDFQEHGRWPIERLRPGAPGRERLLIDAIDAGLVESARALATFAGQIDSRAAPTENDPDGRAVAAPSPPGRRATQGDEGPRRRGPDPIELIASRPWRDLVAPADYFGPVADLNLIDRAAYLGPDSGRVQIADFVPSFNPRLRPLGDFVTRTLLIRIDYWQSFLRRSWIHCQSLRLRDPAASDGEWDRIGDVRRRLSEHVADLEHRCLADESAKLRESCIALVQIYAAFRPRQPFPWLGHDGPPARTAIVFRDRVERRGDATVPDQVAAALAEVAGIYRSEIDPESLIRQKIQAHSLVLVEAPGRREAYWRGERIEVDWGKQAAPWRFLYRLAEAVAHSLGADRFDFPERADFSVKDARFRLKALLPRELMEKIVPAGRGTHKLDLPPAAVYLLRFEEYDRLEEARAARPRLI